MYITHLELTNFRNYRCLELDLPPAIMVFHGANAQGKTNLLESIYLLATTRSHRASSDRDLLHWDVTNDNVLFARLSADVRRERGNAKLEVYLQPDRKMLSETAIASGALPSVPVRKQVRVNGIARRIGDFVGQINVVTFSAQDIDLVAGKPAICRRYLDLCISQLDSSYLRTLQQYQRVLAQRNHLLRLLQEGQSRSEELDFWDAELVRNGSHLVLQRQGLVRELNKLARDIHHYISGSTENLQIAYAPSVPAEGDLSEVEASFRDILQKRRRKEIVQGVTLAGPHRDNLRFVINGSDVITFGSRGQQQTVVLSLKLAEANYMQLKTEDYPILLLDDIFSELDVQRREHLLALVTRYQQVLITATELDYFTPSFLTGVTGFRVSQGNVIPD